MKSKLILGLAMMSGMIYALPVAASSAAYDEAQVVDVEPIMRVIRVSTPRQECWDEEVSLR